MATLSVVRLQKEGRNNLLCLSVCRALFSLFAMPLLAHAWQTAAPPAAGCQAAGQVFGWDLLEHTLSLKSDSGHYSDFRYNDSTIFINGEAILTPQELNINIDDRLCVEAFRTDKQEIASRVRVTLRSDIDAQDRRELVRWQSESLFGTVKSWDARDHKISVSVSTLPDVSVDAAGPITFWSLPTGSDESGRRHPRRLGDTCRWSCHLCSWRTPFRIAKHASQNDCLRRVAQFRRLRRIHGTSHEPASPSRFSIRPEPACPL